MEPIQEPVYIREAVEHRMLHSVLGLGKDHVFFDPGIATVAEEEQAKTILFMLHDGQLGQQIKFVRGPSSSIVVPGGSPSMISYTSSGLE